MCITPDDTCIYEHRAINADTEYRMLIEWQLESSAESLNIHTAPWECELIRRLSKICAKWVLSDTSMFHVFSWSKVLNILLKIKSKYAAIPEGSLVIRIEGYGTVELSGDGCTDTDKEPQMTLGHLDATRFLLGSMPPSANIDFPEDLDSRIKNYIQSVLPLPLWWCNQDRV